MQRQDSKIKALWQPVAYDCRHIVPLQKVSTWSSSDERMHLMHNRLLQPGFLQRPAREVLQDAKITKNEWLTDFVCLHPDHLMRIHIAAHLICFYQVTPEEINSVTENIFQEWKNKMRHDVGKIMHQAEVFFQSDSDETKQATRDVAMLCMQEYYPHYTPDHPLHESTLKAFLRVDQDKKQQRWMNDIVAVHLNQFLSQSECIESLEKKPLKEPGQNKDTVLLGAAGSGKSTLSRQLLLPEQDKTAVMISTDYYRAITFGELDATLSDAQAFIKTQDTAFLIKERVQVNLQQADNRPDIVMDVVTLEPWMNELIQHNEQEAIVAVACLGDAEQALVRAYQRAIESTHSADRGRHINTSALIRGHADASTYLLKTLPQNHAEIVLYNTNTRDRIPRPIATVDTRYHVLTVQHLSQLSLFLGKKYLNPNATSSGTLYYHSTQQKNRFRHTLSHKAAALLAMTVPITNGIPGYSIFLQNKTGENYARIFMNSNHKIQFEIIHDVILRKELLYGDEREMLLELMMQASEFKDKQKYLGKAVCQELVVNDKEIFKKKCHLRTCTR